MKIKMPIKELNGITESESYSASILNRKVLDEYGIFVLKGVVNSKIISKYIASYFSYKKSQFFDRNLTHLTEVNFEYENDLARIVSEEPLKSLARELFPDGAGIYNMRIVKKDAVDVNPVFLHQDIGYQHGGFDRYSFFIPLTRCDVNNGALTFIPGTHHFGYLGDAGAINESILPSDLKVVTPVSEPGDIVVMNSCTWHKSGVNINGSDRVYYDIHVNQANDPASKYFFQEGIVRKYELDYDLDFVFSNSRLQRLKKN